MAKSTNQMSAQALLSKIRATWLHRVAHRMARGVEVRSDFTKELEEFFSLFEQAVATGDPAWLDPVLVDWTASTTQSELEQGSNSITELLSQMIDVTNEIACESLSESEALILLSTLLPVYSHCLERTARLEMEARTSYMTSELVNVQERLEELDRTKSNFIAVAAHELKTPLTLIEGYTAMIQDMTRETGEAQFDNLLHGMVNGVERLQQIIDDMIDISVIDNNLLSLNFQQVTVWQVFKMVEVEFEPLVRERKQTLEVNKFEGCDNWFLADTERIFQAVSNVLTNAIKYTPDQGKIVISGRCLPGFVEITITDNGIGIDPEYQITIFDKFAQTGRANLHSSGKTKFKGGGPGLGLPIARGIIEAHGGTIWVESEGFNEKDCPGSIFHLLLPLRKEKADPKSENIFTKKSLEKEELDG